ncbi:MAG: hypothetical protein FWF12_00305 [Betaproteobacteria bacterium]|nr:hypothetical protein [Betaproteobacteria bacterium]
MNAEQRQAIERKIVRRLIRAMKQKGWNALYVFDGEERAPCKTEREVTDTAFSVDTSIICFQKLRRVQIVLGNNGYNVIADRSLSNPDIPEDDFERIMDEVQEYADQFA